ncbi:MAG: OsmC family protein [Candidatus Saelkia tenebricola]|nr:OsmC family protein [Candidatus Saelkia tenebricola]
MGDIKQRSKKFVYRTTVSWIKEKRGVLSSSSKLTFEVATPPEFKGHKGIWTPEDLFVASINSCIMTTFLYYAEKERLEFLNYESEAEGVLEKLENEFMFSKIYIKPKIVIVSSNQIKKTEEILRYAEENCLISNSVKSKIKIIPDIIEFRGEK